jgi:hypothetical protein
MLLALGITWALLFGAEVGCLVYGRFYLAALAGLAASVTVVAEGIVIHFSLMTALGVFSIAVWFFWQWGGRGRHKRWARKLIGDEARQARDGLVHRIRARRGVWREPSPLPQ